MSKIVRRCKHEHCTNIVDENSPVPGLCWTHAKAKLEGENPPKCSSCDMTGVKLYKIHSNKEMCKDCLEKDPRSVEIMGELKTIAKAKTPAQVAKNIPYGPPVVGTYLRMLERCGVIDRLQEGRQFKYYLKPDNWEEPVEREKPSFTAIDTYQKTIDELNDNNKKLREILKEQRSEIRELKAQIHDLKRSLRVSSLKEKILKEVDDPEKFIKMIDDLGLSEPEKEE